MNANARQLGAILGAALFLMAQAPALAHATLQEARPARDAELATPPKEIVLSFNERLEPAFSQAMLLNADGTPAGAGKAAIDAADPAVMKLPLPALKPGRYRVEYVVVGHDGHRRKGDYSFTVK
jgi:copper resistance protein C